MIKQTISFAYLILSLDKERLFSFIFSVTLEFEEPHVAPVGRKLVRTTNWNSMSNVKGKELGHCAEGSGINEKWRQRDTREEGLSYWMIRRFEEENEFFNNFWASYISSVQFSRSVMSNSLRPHEPQHNRPPCASPTAGVHSNPCPLSRWCYPTIYPLLSPSPHALNLSQYQGFFQWVSSSHQVTKGLELQLQDQSFQWILRVDFLWCWLVWSSCSQRDSQESSNTRLRRHQFFGAQPFLLSSSQIHTGLLEEP